MTNGPIVRRDGGFTLIEVLVTIIIILIGLLGVVALQARASKTEFESYQRGQALSLLRDMETRIAASRAAVQKPGEGYLADSLSSTTGEKYFGVDATATCPARPFNLQTPEGQACTWGDLLRGAAAREDGANVGAMIGARGCLMRVEPRTDNALADFYIVVVWQGLIEGAEPPPDSPAGVNGCAKGVDFGAGLRRGMSLRVLVPDLTKQT